MEEKNIIDQIIEEGEEAREKEDYAKALECFDQALILAGTQSDSTRLISTIAQKLLIYKHLFQKTGTVVFNELMLGEAETGLKLAEKKGVIGQPKAALLLRLGDYQMEAKNYDQAVKQYQQAIENIEQGKVGEYGEYLSHLAWAQALNGEPNAITDLLMAFEQVTSDQTLRPFHKLAILSGIQMRLAESYVKFGQDDKAKEALNTARDMAKQLESEHHMPMRTKQLAHLQERLGI